MTTEEQAPKNWGGACKKAPSGYWCTREHGHNGPCSTVQVDEPIPIAVQTPKRFTVEKSGGPVSYYLVQVNNPNQGAAPYQAECGDIIEALGMDFNMGCAFKALWRTAAAAKLGKVKEGGDAVYDAEKVIFYGGRMLANLKGKKPEKVAAQQAIKLLIESLHEVLKRAARDPGLNPMPEITAISLKLSQHIETL